MIYGQELKEFNQRRIRYIIVGGMAFNLLGGFRSTADLDIIIDMKKGNLLKLVGILYKHGYKLLQPVDPADVLDRKKRTELIKRKNMKTLSFLKDNSLNQVDVIFDSPVPFATALKSIITVKVDGLRLPVVGIDRLIDMKKTAGRPIDRADIAELKVLRDLKDTREQ